MNIITMSKPSFETGNVLSQIVQFDGSKTINKVVLNLTVTTAVVNNFIVGSGGVASFQAANFREGRKLWAFQPMIHWAPSTNWSTSGTTIQNSGQTEFYSNSTDAGFNAPYIKYDVFLDQPGVYDLWGYGYTSSEGVFWSWDDDVTHMRKMVLGTPSGPPTWTKFGSFYSEEGGVNSFSIYLSDAADVFLDQWYFTQDRNHDQYISSMGLEETPLSLSVSPFNTAIRVRSLNGDDLDDLSSPTSGAQIISSWLSSKTILASGKYNYVLETSNAAFGLYEDGLSIDYWQIGGNANHFSSWDFIFTNNSVGGSFISTDYGQNFIEL